jgi:thioredoxin-like negative regulator of GroEL
VIGGLIALVVVLVSASGLGFALRARQGRFRQVRPAPAQSASTPVARLTATDLGTPLGERLTLVQFSTEYCTYCGPTRELLTEVARGREGVAVVEVDAAERMDLTRRLHIMSTPTVMLLDAAGAIASRSSGLPRKQELLARIGSVLGTAVPDRAEESS